jgi:hypothetical protein
MTRSYTVGQSNTVLRRDDHTGPWIDISPTFPVQFNPTWYDVMAVPGLPDIVFIVGSIDQGNTGLMKSTDAGATWLLCDGNWSGGGKILREIWVIDELNAWVVGDQGNVAKTTNGFTFSNPGGQSNGPSKPGGGLFGATHTIHAINSEVAVVGGSQLDTIGENEAYVWKTFDGGNSWIDLNASATYLAPPPPSLRNAQVNAVSALDLSALPSGTGYPINTSFSANTSSNGIGTGLLLDVATGLSGEVTGIGITLPGQNYEVGDIITVLGGNNDCIITVSFINQGSPTGTPGGIFISLDQQNIVVSTGYTQQLSTDGGSTFLPIPPQMTRSGKHLTWYPSHPSGLPDIFRHTGGPIFHINDSTDGGASWTTQRQNDGITIKGAHFYSPQNGYYLTLNQIHSTSNGGVTSDAITYQDPVQISLEAVWTEEEDETQSTPCYLFTPCDGSVQPSTWSGAELTQHNGHVIEVEFSQAGVSVILCGTLTELTDPDLCLSAQLFSPANTVLATYDDCVTCEGPPPPPDVLTECYNLIACPPKTCPDILYATDLELAPFIGQYIEINGDTACRYLVESTRQAYYTGLNPSILSLPGGAFQSGTDNQTIQVTSVVVNGTEYVPGLATPYVLTPANYSVVECTDLVCVPVAVNTTENCVTNLPSYLNNIFANSNVPELVAECADTDYCSILGTSLTKIQYTEGTTFTITFTIQNNSGTLTYVYSASAGNITNLTILSDSQFSGIIDIDTCSSQTQCTGNLVIDTTEPINTFTECPPLSPGEPDGPPVELGEACETRPRFAEPGFSTKYCNPQQVVDINCKFGDSVYALFKRMRYGIQTCCEYDLDKIEIKKDLMDLGALYDPDLCTPGQPVPFGCCPQPCDVEADLQIPMFMNCPAPTDVIATITGVPINPPELCFPPTGILDNGEPLVVMTLAAKCSAYTGAVNGGGGGVIPYFDCNNVKIIYNYPAFSGWQPFTFCGIADQTLNASNHKGFEYKETPNCGETPVCITYTLTFPANLSDGIYSWLDCNGVAQVVEYPFVAIEYTEVICAQEGSLFTDGPIVIEGGECP